MEETIEMVLCPICEGEGLFLGNMGSFAHFSCRDCGMAFMRDNHYYENADLQEGEQNSPSFPFHIQEIDIYIKRERSYGDDLEETLTLEKGIFVMDENDVENTRSAFSLVWAELYPFGTIEDPIITFDFERKD